MNIAEHRRQGHNLVSLFFGYASKHGIELTSARMKNDQLVGSMSMEDMNRSSQFSNRFSKIEGNQAILDLSDLHNKSIVGDFDFDVIVIE